MINWTKDSHIHTNYSPDADPDVTFQQYIDRALELGLTELVFTDHVDFDAVHPLFHEMIDYDEYITVFRRVQESSPIPIYLGVEVGYQSHMKDTINAFIDKYDFDFVILSIHYIEQKDLYTQEYFEGKTKKEAYTIYFDAVLDAIENVPNFDVFGHLDYITRYSPFGHYLYNDYKNQIDAILTALITRKKGIEINTSGIDKEGEMYPSLSVIKQYLSLGGRKITLGSDAHRISELGRHFKYVENKLKAILG